MIRRWAALAARSAQAALWVPVGYIAVITVAGLRPPRRVAPASAAQHVVVLVPAHDEESAIGETVRGIFACDYPRSRLRVVVVADNCSDATSERARAAGADVWERVDPDRRGKGAALRWALERLRNEPDWETVAMVDADTSVHPWFLRAVGDRRASGAAVVQGEYRVANADASLVARLAEVAFAMQSVLRQRGRAGLGAAARLQGNGMAFARDVADPRDWDAGALTEDLDTWLSLVRRGIHPRFEPQARVAGLMPTTVAAARVQRSRWDAGRLQLMRRHVVPGLRQAAARRNLVVLEAVLSELVFPPPSTLAGAIAAAGLGRKAATGRSGSAGAQAAILAAHAVAALIVSRASVKTYAALALAPAAVAWKLALRAELALGRAPAEWTRTPRPQ